MLLVGANNQTNDLVCALPVEAVRSGEVEFLALFAVAAIRWEQAPRCLNEHVDGKLRSGIDKRNDGKRVGCILGAAQRRQMELIGERMTHFVKADEEHVADDEVGLVARILPSLLSCCICVASSERGAPCRPQRSLRSRRPHSFTNDRSTPVTGPVPVQAGVVGNGPQAAVLAAWVKVTDAQGQGVLCWHFSTRYVLGAEDFRCDGAISLRGLGAQPRGQRWRGRSSRRCRGAGFFTPSRPHLFRVWLPGSSYAYAKRVMSRGRMCKSNTAGPTGSTIACQLSRLTWFAATA